MTTRTTDPAEWDQNFFSVDQEMLFDIILAANYLEIIPLLCAVLFIYPTGVGAIL